MLSASESGSESATSIFSIGHSNHQLEVFIELLTRHGIEVLVDVRSQPWSRFAAWFNRDTLEPEIKRAGARYLFMGDVLGGRPEADEFFDAENHVLYDRVARADFFVAGLERLQRGSRSHRIALMCAEENPTGCHRRLLIGRALAPHGVELVHIRAGRLQTEDDLERELVRDDPRLSQQTLLGVQAELAWRSVRPVSRRRSGAKT